MKPSQLESQQTTVNLLQTYRRSEETTPPRQILLEILANAFGVEGTLYPDAASKLVEYAGSLQLFTLATKTEYDRAIEVQKTDEVLGAFALSVYTSIRLNSSMLFGGSGIFFNFLEEGIIVPEQLDSEFSELALDKSSKQLQENPLLVVAAALRFFIVEMSPMIKQVKLVQETVKKAQEGN